MTHPACPSLVIAATGSGVGKTSLTLGLARALTRRGLRVQTFKVGPDFLDPTHLAVASGRTCYNLDGWMTSRPYVAELFAQATAGADVALIEGVMGLFDGASPTTLEGSTAEIAAWLDVPVLLVVNAHGAARSLAATVQGFARFEPAVHVASVIANQSGSPRHRQWLAEALSAANLPPLLGAVPRDALPKLESRHLGLVAADAQPPMQETIDQLAAACQQHLDLEQILALAGIGPCFGQKALPSEPALPEIWAYPPRHQNQTAIRLGIARDEAFSFYYPDNLEQLQAQGAELVHFSPLADAALPANLDGIYFGGGYPEAHAAGLSANRAMCQAVRDFAASGRCVYAECGGLMYLARSLSTGDGQCWPLAGVLPVDTAMLPRLSMLGYVETTSAAGSPWGPAGWSCRGHEFHYSHIVADDSRADGWQPAYHLQRRRAAAGQSEGFVRGNVVASYVHLHWASRPSAVRHFLQRCQESA